MLYDITNSLNPKRGMSPVAATTDDTAYVSQILDCQGLYGAMFVLLTGSIADVDATFTVLVQHGDVSNLSDAVAVPDDELNGTEALATPLFSSDDKCFKIGYRGNKRYVRVTVTPAANTGNIFMAGTWITQPLIVPAVNPPN